MGISESPGSPGGRSESAGPGAGTASGNARTPRDLTKIRRWAIIAWVVLMVVELSVHGLAFDRTRLIILLCLGLIAACIGRRRTMSVIRLFVFQSASTTPRSPPEWIRDLKM